ncbi:WD repeat domain phosphoinositide-interacting protein 4-like [Brevipalpus obovatus]|uniref:WD repeat domain phosphoinositide-interacting protein 4-like n=1 Tax=Brevipalpus obovatus TaxID=246614 RepID=UPI003D9EA384
MIQENYLDSKLESEDSCPEYFSKMVSNERKEINNVQFNQEHNLFTCSMETGVKVYNVDPLAIKTSLDTTTCGSVAHCHVLHRTNLFAIVGGGSKPKFADNAVVIWDDHKKSFVLEFTFSSPILSVRTRKDRLVVVEYNRVHVFTFPQNPKRLFAVDTGDNPKGICEISPYTSSERQVMVFPGYRVGSLQIMDLNSTEPGSSASPVNIMAHQGEIACMALNNQGTMVATASVKGTLIRVYDTTRKTLIVELRRGTDPATLYSINFSPDSDFLVASSDKGTVHIFALKDTRLNKRSTLSKMGFLGQYVESQWALTNFTVKDDCASICGFGPKSSVYAICEDGSFHKYIFSQDGSCKRSTFERFVDLTEEDDFLCI